MKQKQKQIMQTEPEAKTAQEPEAAQEKERKALNVELPEPSSYEEAIEAILFAAGHPVSYETLAKAFALRAPILRNMVKEYAERYNHSKVPRGVILLAMDEECQLCTKSEYLEYIRVALGIRRNGTISAATMEVLAIIAYHQPVTRAYVDAVRGVDSSYAVTSLSERGLIEPKGRLDAPGRPMLFGTTSAFLRCFGLDTISELPSLPSEEVASVFQKIDEQMEAEAMEADPNQLTISPDLLTVPAEETSAQNAGTDEILPPDVATSNTDPEHEELSPEDPNLYPDDLPEQIAELVPEHPVSEAEN